MCCAALTSPITPDLVSSPLVLSHPKQRSLRLYQSPQVGQELLQHRSTCSSTLPTPLYWTTESPKSPMCSIWPAYHQRALLNNVVHVILTSCHLFSLGSCPLAASTSYPLATSGFCPLVSSRSCPLASSRACPVMHHGPGRSPSWGPAPRRPWGLCCCGVVATAPSPEQALHSFS
jgi:hypothetical protein